MPIIYIEFKLSLSDTVTIVKHLLPVINLKVID